MCLIKSIDSKKLFQRLLNCFTTLTAYSYIDKDNTEQFRFKYKVSSLQVTDSARILISTGFMRGYIVVDVGYTQE